MSYNPAFENKFFKEQKRRFSNVFPYWSTRKSTEIEILDSRVLDAIIRARNEEKLPITEAKIKEGMRKSDLKAAKRFGGLKASLERLERIGAICKDKERGWEVD